MAGTYGELLRLDQSQQTVKQPESPSGQSPAPNPSSHPLSVSSSKRPKPRRKTEPSPTMKRESNRDTMPPRHHATMPPRLHDTMVETIRATVKAFGKEAATHRFTPEEKTAIADLVYTYHRSGLRTNENEITRIAVNFIVNDFQENGKNSVLERVLKALNS